MNEDSPGPRILAVASGKGGVGKTWLSITLAHALVRSARRVLLFAGDLGLANVDVQLGLMPSCDLGAVATGRVTLAEAVFRHEGGFDILPGQSGSGSLALLKPRILDQMLAALRAAASGYDVVVLDLGAGIDRGVRRMSVFADTLLVVATDEPTSLTDADAYAVLKLYAGDAGGGRSDARIVVNQAASRPAGQRTFDALAHASRKFLGHTPKLAGIIRRDERVREAIRRQTLLLVRHPSAPAAVDVEALAAGLAS
ncbi:MAG TPA: MinD/ParA family protein [Acetobacteraceae bacterium]